MTVKVFHSAMFAAISVRTMQCTKGKHGPKFLSFFFNTACQTLDRIKILDDHVAFQRDLNLQKEEIILSASEEEIC
jgi:hypothetical protein